MRICWFLRIGMAESDVGKSKNREVKFAPCPRHKVSQNSNFLDNDYQSLRNKWHFGLALTCISLIFFAFAAVNHEPNSSVLDCCFSADGSTVFSGGTDNAVRMWQLNGAAPPNGLAQQIGVHDAPVKGVCFLPRTNLVVSGGWDRKLKFWDCRSPNPAGVLDLPERVYAMDARDDLLVVATANRHIISYDVPMIFLLCSYHFPMIFQFFL